MASVACDAIREQLGALIDGELAAGERAAIESHLRLCPACAAEHDALTKLAAELAECAPVTVPETLWPAIESGLDARRSVRTGWFARQHAWRPVPRFWAAAASVLLVIGLGIVAVSVLQGITPSAEAATIDYNELLSSVTIDPAGAFRSFVKRYQGSEIAAADAARLAPELDFALPSALPNGFERRAVYRVRFGSSPGIAAEYVRGADEYLVTIFHPPVHREDYGTHKDYPCVVGEHRGHAVEVGGWRLVHLTDPTTCHCVLSRLDPQTELPAVMSAVAPHSTSGGEHGH